MHPLHIRLLINSTAALAVTMVMALLYYFLGKPFPPADAITYGLTWFGLYCVYDAIMLLYRRQ